jgi:TetR/AcrR family transcriptional regulator, regulator of cefoperazone and chloramphenicol sensitivity
MESHHDRLAQGELGLQTRERLLDAAESLFARRGYSGTSVRDITRSADCNVAAVNYHFRSKRNLYLEMFRRRLVAMREQRVASTQQALATARGPEALEVVLRAFADAFLQPLVATPDGRVLIELMAREMLDAQLPPEMFVAEVFGPVQQALTDALLRTTPSLDESHARLCVLSIVGQLLQVAHRSRRAAHPGNKALELPPMAEVVEHVVRFSAAGVRACCEVAR